MPTASRKTDPADSETCHKGKTPGALRRKIQSMLQRCQKCAQKYFAESVAAIAVPSLASLYFLLKTEIAQKWQHLQSLNAQTGTAALVSIAMFLLGVACTLGIQSLLKSRKEKLFDFEHGPYLFRYSKKNGGIDVKMPPRCRTHKNKLVQHGEGYYGKWKCPQCSCEMPDLSYDSTRDTAAALLEQPLNQR